MNAQQIRNNQQNNKNGLVQLKEYFYICLSKWTWFVASFVVFMALAELHLIRQTPIYYRSASLLIKEEGKNSRSSLSSQLSSASDFGMFSTNTNVQNELTTIIANSTVLETVKRLHLDMQYTVKEAFGLRNKVLYGRNLPFTVNISGIDDNTFATFDIELKDDNKVEISNLTVAGVEYSNIYTVAFNTPVKTPAGKITVKPSEAVGLSVLENIKYKSVHVTRIGYIASVGICSANLTAELDDKKNTIIKLTYNDASIQRAEDFLNTLISVYNENWVKDRNQIAVSTSEFISERLQVIEKELGHVDSDISSYKSANQITDVGATANMYMDKASQANAQVLDLNNVLYMARYIRNFITNEANAFQLLPANSGLNNPVIENQIAQYNEKLLQRNSIISNSSTNNPMVQRLDENLLELRGIIVASIDNQIRSLNQEISSYRSVESQSTARLSSSPTQAKYLLSVERQQKVKEALYLFLLQKREENELSQAFTAYNTRIINPPSGPLAPFAPNKNKIRLYALVAAFLVPIGLIFTKETFLNTKIRSKKDLKSLTIPFVGEIPLVRIKRDKDDENEYKIVVQDKVRNIINEAFRVVRTNMEFMFNGATEHNVVMLTSSNPGSGKTFLSANIAVSLAIKNKRVALIDLDMRRASLSTFIDSPDNGISNYLSNQIDDWNEIICKGQLHANVDIIPVGTIPPNPTELLFNPKLEAMIAQLKEEYDYLLIDCPPVEIVADADIINKLVDLTIFVIRANLFEKDILPEVEGYYQDKKYKNMATILNATEATHGKYGYGRYGYGRYGYGYGNDKKKKKK